MNPNTVFDTDFLADPHAAYRRLRQAGPIHATTAPDGTPIWLVTSYQHVRQALADPRLSLNKANSAARSTHGSSMPTTLDRHLLNLDPPDHTRLRRLAAHAFTPRRIEQTRQPIHAACQRLLHDIAARGQADLIADYASQLPMIVICDLLGIPADMRLNFRAWTNRLLSPDPTGTAAARQAMGHMQHFLGQVLVKKRTNPGDDMLSALIAARDDQDQLTEEELLSMVFLLLYAGVDNTTNLIANTTLAVLNRPELRDAIQTGEIQLENVIEETLRWEPPFPLAVRRFTTEAVQLADTKLPTGTRIWLCLAAANRDPERYRFPEQFDVTRTDNQHLTFGHGPHYCLGAAMARHQASIAVATLLQVLPTVRLPERWNGPTWRPSFHHRGPKELPVNL